MAGGFPNKIEVGGNITAAELLWVQTGDAGVLLLTEQASSPSATAGKSKVYSKTDNKLYFLDEAGVETEITGAGSGVTVETPGGAVDAVNNSFTVTSVPKWVVSDGVTYFQNLGYTIASLVITMDIAPSSFIRAVI